MNKFILIILFLNFKSFAAFDSYLNLQIDLWEQQPSGVPHGRLSKNYSLYLEEQNDSGSIRVYDVPLSLVDFMKVKLKIYTIVPLDSYPSYFQIKLEVLEPFYILCAQSVEWKKNGDFPPLICAGRENLDHNIFGITIVSNSKHYNAKSQ